MTQEFDFSVNKDQPGSELLMEEFLKEVQAFDIGTVKEVKEKPKDGTLAVDLVLIGAILLVASLTLDIIVNIIALAKEVQSRHATKYGLEPKNVPSITMVFIDQSHNKHQLIIPSKHSDETQFIEDIKRIEGKNDSSSTDTH